MRARMSRSRRRVISLGTKPAPVATTPARAAPSPAAAGAALGAALMMTGLGGSRNSAGSTASHFFGLADHAARRHVGGSTGVARGVTTLFTPETVLVAARDQVSCDLAGEAAILHLGSGMYYSLDRVGARAWSLVQSPTSFRHVRDTLLAEYDVTAERLEQDLAELLNTLLAERLIEVRHDSAH